MQIRAPALTQRPRPVAPRAGSLGSRAPPSSEDTRPVYAIPTPADLGRFRKPDPVAGPAPAHLHPNSHPAW